MGVAMDGIREELAELRGVVLATVEWYMAPDFASASRKLGDVVRAYLEHKGIKPGEPT